MGRSFLIVSSSSLETFYCCHLWKPFLSSGMFSLFLFCACTTFYLNFCNMWFKRFITVTVIITRGSLGIQTTWRGGKTDHDLPLVMTKRDRAFCLVAQVRGASVPQFGTGSVPSALCSWQCLIHSPCQARHYPLLSPVLGVTLLFTSSYYLLKLFTELFPNQQYCFFWVSCLSPNFMPVVVW